MANLSDPQYESVLKNVLLASPSIFKILSLERKQKKTFLWKNGIVLLLTSQGTGLVRKLGKSRVQGKLKRSNVQPYDCRRSHHSQVTKSETLNASMSRSMSVMQMLTTLPRTWSEAEPSSSSLWYTIS